MRQEQGTQQPWTMVVEVLSALVAWNMTVRLRLRALVARQRRRVGTALLLALFLLSSTLGLFVQNGGVAMAAPVARGPQPGTSARPTNTLSSADLSNLGKRVIVLPQAKGHIATSAQAATPPSPIARPTGITMKSATISLSASATTTHATTQATTWTSSDQRLTVTVPAGAVTPALVTAGKGGVRLQMQEIAGPSGGMGMGASGRISLGTYQFTLYGQQNVVLHAALAKPITLSLALGTWQGAGFDLSHVLFIVNGSAPKSALVNAATGKLDPTLVNAKPEPFAATLNRTAGALQVVIPLTSGGTTSGSWNTDSPQAHWDAQADTGVDLSSGDLTYSYPLDVPPGAGGLTPNLTLSYDSSSVANEHNPQATAGWLGEGWDMSLGSITWGEHDVYTSDDCTFSNCTCTLINCTIWDNMWQFSDAFGNGGDLIPQNSNVSPWYDDSIHGQVPTPNEPISWNIASEPRIKIESYTNPTANNNFPSQFYPTQPPCFRAFLPNGYMEEFGCTPDSLEFYVDQSPYSAEYKGNYISSWNLDMIVDPNGNQIHITYNQYQNYDKVDGATQFPIDAAIKSITYDSPSCLSTTTMCTGSNWKPQVQILFNTATAATRLTGAACPTFTNSTTYLYHETMRCDDVQDLSGSGGLAAPDLQSLAILNDVQVQVSTSGSSPSWNTLRDYQFSYDQGAATTTTDPSTGLQESVAGYLDLTKIQEVGDDGSTTLPPLTMTYTPQVETYVDTLALPAPSTNCGPSWNTYSGCPLWSEFTGYYLTDMTNGQGWDETYTYALAHNNTHGVNTGLTLEDPLTCNGANQSSSPCRLADDENWSKYVLTQRQANVACVALNGSGCGSNGTDLLTSTSSYTYRLTDLKGQECSGCTVGMYWGDQNDGDTLDFYNGTFMGFHTTQVTNPDGSQQLYTFESGEGYGVADSTIHCSPNFPVGCTVVPWTDSANFLHGQVIEEDDYDTNGITLLQKTTTSYVSGTNACPANGISGSAYNTTDPTSYYVGQRTSELDINNPITVCEIEPSQTVESVYDGNTSHVDTTTAYTYTYDGSGHMTAQTVTTSASDTSQTPHVVDKTQYTWHDAITTSGTSAHGPYFNLLTGLETTQDGSGNVKACAYTGYDGGTVGATGSQTGISHGLVTETTQYSTNCTPGSLSGPISTKRAYNAHGDVEATLDADAVAGVSGHTTSSCTYNSATYTACTGNDGIYSSHIAFVTNDLAQKTNLGYQDTSGSSTPAAGNGWGQWLTSTTDANSQKTLFEYDPLGRLTASVKPGAAYGDTWTSPTTSYAYPITCAATGAQEPCAALTTTQQLGSGDTTTSATYYDGWGRPVETVTPSSLSGTTCTVSVAYTEYDASGRKAFVSDPYFSTIANDASCTPSYVRPDSTQPGTTTAYDGLGRVVSTEDALSNTTTTTYTVGAPTGGANITDSALYEATAVVDANGHQTRTLVDGLGHTRYVEQFTGTSGSYALEGTTQQNYDWLGNVVSVYEPNVGSGGAGLSTTAQTTATYNLNSEATTTTDTDLGTMTTAYDPNGNLTESVDARGSSGGTVYAGYDGLNRQLWRNTTNSPTNAYVTYTYDQTTGHGYGVGRLTTENYTNGAGGSSVSLSGSHTYIYDERGQVTSQADSVTGVGTNYSFSMAYNDAGQPTGMTYSDGEVLGMSYNAYGWLNQIQTTPSGQSATTLATNISYTGVAGAGMQPTSASIANGTYTYSASFDADLRLTADNLTTTSATLYSATRGYDAVGNVISEDTQLGSASTTDNQLFCYDEQNRLTWAGATGTSPCNGAVSSGTLTSAYYSQAYSYDAQGRLTSGAIGSYTYGSSSHPHAVTSIGGGTYTASYDAAGNMTCRAPNSSVTCSGTPTGATMTYDAERRLAHWQNTPASPTTQDDYLYDGEGNRVEQYVNTSGTITSTAYLAGGVEEVSGSMVTKYLGAKGLPVAVRVGTAGALNYLAADGLGSMSVAVDGSGNVVASQLFGPYGTSRYSNGTMPTSRGFTGERADATTGLDYYGARYYDPAAGQFTTADTVMNGLSRYAYVHGNPETATDPSGHLVECATCNDGGPSGYGTLPDGIKDTITKYYWTDKGSDGNNGELWVYTTYTEITYDSGAVSDTNYVSKSVDYCNDACANARNTAARDKAASEKALEGNILIGFGSFISAVGSFLLGAVAAAVKGILAAGIALLSLLGVFVTLYGLSSLTGVAGQIFGVIGYIVTAIDAAASFVMGLGVGVYLLTLGVEAFKVAAGIATDGLGSIAILGIGVGLSIIGAGLNLFGEGVLSVADTISHTSVSDWCAGGGSCQSSNGGALQNAGLLPPCYTAAGCSAGSGVLER